MKQKKDEQHEQVVNDANSSDDDINDLKSQVTDVGKIHRLMIGTLR